MITLLSKNGITLLALQNDLPLYFMLRSVWSGFRSQMSDPVVIEIICLHVTFRWRVRTCLLFPKLYFGNLSGGFVCSLEHLAHEYSWLYSKYLKYSWCLLISGVHFSLPDTGGADEWFITMMNKHDIHLLIAWFWFWLVYIQIRHLKLMHAIIRYTELYCPCGLRHNILQRNTINFYIPDIGFEFLL